MLHPLIEDRRKKTVSAMKNNNITSIAIVGGGTAGWMAAAALAKVVGTKHCKITLVESEDIGTVGVGEATIPPINQFNDILGLDVHEVLKATQGTFKLGIEFANWGALGQRYMHPFGVFGSGLKNIPFHHYLRKACDLGISPGLEAYSINIAAAQNNKFMRQASMPNSPPMKVAHAFHFDASLYAKFLRQFSVGLGVERLEGIVNRVDQDSHTGYLTKLHISDNRSLTADFFIDCSGFRGLLIEQTLKTGYQDWSHYLPCNSALAVPTKATTPILPYTKSTAHAFGWQWRIPLQHRTGNGFVYSDQYISDANAADLLVSNLDADPLAEPRQLRFVTGKRNKTWNKNCLALGLAGGFMEPLESTSIHLIQSGISKFLGLFPRNGDFEAEMNRYNNLMDKDFLSIRDFLILHYKATTRDDSPFWNYCRTMPIPDSLQDKLELYRSSSGVYRDNNELFSEASWLAVLSGQGVQAQGYNPLVDLVPIEQLDKQLRVMRDGVTQGVEAMPSHEQYIQRYCRFEGFDDKS